MIKETEVSSPLSTNVPDAAAAVVDDALYVSVVMPAYNAEKTLKEAMRSVLSQTHRNLELIVVDDCSIDSTLELASCIASGDDRVRVIASERNEGVSYSRRKGALAASYEWIALLDSDDIWTPDKLEKQIQLQSDTGARLLYTGSGFMDADGVPIGWVLHVPDRMDYKATLDQNLISNSSVLVDRRLFLDHMVCRDDIHEDFACWLSILKGGELAYGIDEPLLIYRLSSSSKSGNKIVSAAMNWKTYRYSGLGVITSLRHMVRYTMNGLKKYRSIAEASQDGISSQ